MIGPDRRLAVLFAAALLAGIAAGVALAMLVKSTPHALDGDPEYQSG